MDLSHYEIIPLHRKYIDAKIIDAIVEKSIDSYKVSTDEEDELATETNTDDWYVLC